MVVARKSESSSSGRQSESSSSRRQSQPSSSGRQSQPSSSGKQSETSSSGRQRGRTKKAGANPVSSSSSKQKTNRMPLMPPGDALPMWLLKLNSLHRYSGIATFLLVTSTLVVYGWTVYSQQLWGQTYRKIQNLQRQERQLTTTNEVLKNRAATQAERPTSGLVPPSPSGQIFLSPAPDNPPSQNLLQNPSQSSLTPPSNAQPQNSPPPLGY